MRRVFADLVDARRRRALAEDRLHDVAPRDHGAQPLLGDALVDALGEVNVFHALDRSVEAGERVLEEDERGARAAGAVGDAVPDVVDEVLDVRRDDGVVVLGEFRRVVVVGARRDEDDVRRPVAEIVRDHDVPHHLDVVGRLGEVHDVGDGREARGLPHGREQRRPSTRLSIPPSAHRRARLVAGRDAAAGDGDTERPTLGRGAHARGEEVARIAVRRDRPRDRPEEVEAVDDVADDPVRGRVEAVPGFTAQLLSHRILEGRGDQGPRPRGVRAHRRPADLFSAVRFDRPSSVVRRPVRAPSRRQRDPHEEETHHAR